MHSFNERKCIQFITLECEKTLPISFNLPCFTQLTKVKKDLISHFCYTMTPLPQIFASPPPHISDIVFEQPIIYFHVNKKKKPKQ